MRFDSKRRLGRWCIVRHRMMLEGALQMGYQQYNTFFYEMYGLNLLEL